LAAGSLVGGCILGSVLGAGTLGLVGLLGLVAWVCAHTESVSDAAMSSSDRFLIFFIIFCFLIFNNYCLF
jgi:branched-subunit amino acid ABC-type transport system permease component